MEHFFNKVEYEKTIQTKREEWEAFMNHNIILDSVDPVIAQSWIRSKSQGIDPYNPSPKFLNDDEFKELQQSNKILIKYAKPLMNKIFELGGDAVNLMSLHDKNGYMLDISTREGTTYSWREETFRPGVCWSEQEVGTNALGLAIITGKPVLVLGSEHYCYVQRDICCCAAPIHNSNGELLGVLNVSGPYQKYTPHLLTLVVYGAYAIECQIEAYQSHEFLETIINVVSEGMIMLDRHYNITRCSIVAAQIFDAKPSQLIGNHIQDVIHIPKLETYIKKSSAPFQCRECNSYFNDKRISCDVTVTPIFRENHFWGAVLILRGTKSINKEVNILTGNQARYTFDDIITEDSKILNIIKAMKDAANTDCSILISGESGTGKELFAHAIHSYSKRRDEPFIAVNCASLPRSLVESELFGYEKGAFSGALHEGNPGKFELSNGGTIFLDEIGEMPLEIQPKLLRVLDTHCIRRIGGKTEKELDIRVIAATNRNLFEEVKKKNFREDLFYRLNVLNFNIPPLRDRIDDIEYLVEHTVEHLNKQSDGFDKTVSDEVISVLKRYSWPGNVRELQNAIVRAYYCCQSRVIEPNHLMLQNNINYLDNNSVRFLHSDTLEKLSVEEYERHRIIDCLKKCSGNVLKASEILMMSRATLYRRIKRYNINLKIDI